MSTKYRCTKKTCPCEGPRNEGRYCVSGTDGYIACPTCGSVCRAANLVQKKPRIVGKLPKNPEMDWSDDAPRTCTKCGFEGKVKDFQKTTARGMLTVRAWCPPCMAAYFRTRNGKGRGRRNRVSGTEQE